MLNIQPFSYGLAVQQVYEAGSIYTPEVLDISNDDLIATFLSGLANVAALSLEICYPNKASAPHMVVNGFKNLLAIAAESDVTFKEAEKVKEYLADPSKFAAAIAAAAPVATSTKAPAQVAQASKKEEEKEESDDDMGLSLFD